MNRWILSLLFVGVGLAAAPAVQACDHVAVAAASQSVVFAEGPVLAVAPQVVLSTAVVTPQVVLAPSVVVAPTVFEARAVRVRVGAAAVRVRLFGSSFRSRCARGVN